MNYTMNRNLIFLATLILMSFGFMTLHSVFRGVTAEWYWYEWMLMVSPCILAIVYILIAPNFSEVE